MMRKLITLFVALGFLAPTIAFAQFTTVQGGTGTSSPSGILYGDGSLRLKTVTIGSNLTFSGGTLSATGGGSGGTGAATSSFAALFPIQLLTSASTITYSFGGLSTTSPWTVGQLAMVQSDNQVSSVATTSVTCTGNASCSPFTVIGTSPITINAAGGSGLTWMFGSLNNFGTTTVSTTTSITTQGVFFSSSTSAFSVFPYASTTGLTISGTASTTNLVVSGATTLAGIVTGANRMLIINSTGLVSTIGFPLSAGNGGTGATALTGSMLLGTNSAGSAIVATSTPTADHYLATSTTASIFPYASTTMTSFTTASSSFYYGGQLSTCIGTGNKITWDAGTFRCEADQTGGGGIAYPFTPTTNFGMLTQATSGTPYFSSSGIFASSSNSQLILTDANTNDPAFGFRVTATGLTIATTSGTTLGTTTGSGVFTIATSGSLCTGIGCTPMPVNGLYLRDQDGTGPRVYFGGNSGGDTNYMMQRLADNDATNDDPFNFGLGDFGANSVSSIFSTWLPNGNFGIGSTTPWGLLSIAAPTYNYQTPIFALATSTGPFGSLITVFGTSTTMSRPAEFSAFPESGIRMTIGNNTYSDNSSALDHIYNDGRYASSWAHDECRNFGNAGTSITVATPYICGFMQFVLTGITASLAGDQISPITSGRAGVSLALNMTVANAGAALLVGSPSRFPTNTQYASTTPILEVAGGIASPNATGTQYYIGLTQQNENAMQTAPTDGCYFTTSLTLANWQAECKSASTPTTVDTGVSTSTKPWETKFRLEYDKNKNVARFYMKGSTASTTQLVATITTNLPAATTLLSEKIGLGAVTGGTNSGTTKRYLNVYGVQMWTHQDIDVLP